jgi:hypothetical protein
MTSVAPRWATDELFLKVKGNMKYLYAMMDEQTRFWIAQEVVRQSIRLMSDHSSNSPNKLLAKHQEL